MDISVPNISMYLITSKMDNLMSNYSDVKYYKHKHKHKLSVR